MPTEDSRRPFIEVVEVCQRELVREAAGGEEPKYKGMVNQIYSNDLAQVLPESFIKKEAFLTLVADHTAGTVTVGSGTSNVIGSSTSWTTAHTNMLLRVDGADAIYRMTFEAGTSLTFQDSLTWIGSSGTGLSYTLFQDRYQLPTDFSHMLADDPQDPHVVYRWVGGQKIYLDPKIEEEYDREDAHGVGTPHAYLVKWLRELPYLYITLSADSAEIVGYSYIPQLTTLTEYTTGTATFNTTTAVTADSGTTTWSANVDTSANTYYIRNEADGTGSNSKWVKISSVSGASALTLAEAWTHTSGTGQSYTISEISKWPARFDDAMLYKTALILDPDNVNITKWNQIYLDAVGMDKAQETKRMQTRRLKRWPGLRDQGRRGNRY